jgi:FKBP-type peptidyl-prolyl cis-trans isomerase SlyD
MTRARQLLAVVLVVFAPLVATAQTQPAPTPGAAAPDAAPPAIEAGSTVRLEYTLKDDAGTLLDSNKGRAPLTYTHGQNQIVPGLEKELKGMHAGEEKRVVVKPEDGYGTVNPSAQTEVPKEMLPAEAMNVGTRLMARNAAGDGQPVTVKEIKDKTVVLDLNHPLAGKTLLFDVKVLDVEPPKAGDPASKN